MRLIIETAPASSVSRQPLGTLSKLAPVPKRARL